MRLPIRSCPFICYVWGGTLPRTLGASRAARAARAPKVLPRAMPKPSQIHPGAFPDFPESPDASTQMPRRRRRWMPRTRCLSQVSSPRCLPRCFLPDASSQMPSPRCLPLRPSARLSFHGASYQMPRPRYFPEYSSPDYKKAPVSASIHFRKNDNWIFIIDLNYFLPGNSDRGPNTRSGQEFRNAQGCLETLAAWLGARVWDVGSKF